MTFFITQNPLHTPSPFWWERDNGHLARSRRGRLFDASPDIERYLDEIDAKLSSDSNSGSQLFISFDERLLFTRGLVDALVDDYLPSKFRPVSMVIEIQQVNFRNRHDEERFFVMWERFAVALGSISTLENLSLKRNFDPNVTTGHSNRLTDLRFLYKLLPHLKQIRVYSDQLNISLHDVHDITEYAASLQAMPKLEEVSLGYVREDTTVFQDVLTSLPKLRSLSCNHFSFFNPLSFKRLLLSQEMRTLIYTGDFDLNAEQWKAIAETLASADCRLSEFILEKMDLPGNFSHHLANALAANTSLQVLTLRLYSPSVLMSTSTISLQSSSSSFCPGEDEVSLSIPGDLHTPTSPGRDLGIALGQHPVLEELEITLDMEATDTEIDHWSELFSELSISKTLKKLTIAGFALWTDEMNLALQNLLVGRHQQNDDSDSGSAGLSELHLAGYVPSHYVVKLLTNAFSGCSEDFQNEYDSAGGIIDGSKSRRSGGAKLKTLRFNANISKSFASAPFRFIIAEEYAENDKSITSASALGTALGASVALEELDISLPTDNISAEEKNAWTQLFVSFVSSVSLFGTTAPTGNICNLSKLRLANVQWDTVPMLSALQGLLRQNSIVELKLENIGSYEEWMNVMSCFDMKVSDDAIGGLYDATNLKSSRSLKHLTLLGRGQNSEETVDFKKGESIISAIEKLLLKSEICCNVEKLHLSINEVNFLASSIVSMARSLTQRNKTELLNQRCSPLQSITLDIPIIDDASPSAVVNSLCSNYDLTHFAGDGLTVPNHVANSVSFFQREHKAMLDGLLRMNDAGRKYIADDPMNKRMALRVLEVVRTNLDCLFVHLCENPFICQ